MVVIEELEKRAEDLEEGYSERLSKYVRCLPGEDPFEGVKRIRRELDERDWRRAGDSPKDGSWFLARYYDEEPELTHWDGSSFRTDRGEHIEFTHWFFIPPPEGVVRVAPPLFPAEEDSLREKIAELEDMNAKQSVELRAVWLELGAPDLPLHEVVKTRNKLYNEFADTSAQRYRAIAELGDLTGKQAVELDALRKELADRRAQDANVKALAEYVATSHEANPGWHRTTAMSLLADSPWLKDKT